MYFRLKNWEVLQADVKWWRLADAYQAGYSRLEFNTVELSEASKAADFICEDLDRNFKAVSLNGIPPPGNLNRAIQKWLDQNKPAAPSGRGRR